MAYGKDDFESIVRKHQAMVYSIGYNFFRNVEIAEEIAQDVFLQLYRRLDSIESAAHLVPWLRRTSTHRCIDRLRREGSRQEIQMDDVPDIEDATSEADPFRDEKLHRLVASLPGKQRTIVILRYGQDMDAIEIAAMLDMPVSTVRSDLQRALALLREKAVGCFGGARHGSI